MRRTSPPEFSLISVLGGLITTLISFPVVVCAFLTVVIVAFLVLEIFRGEPTGVLSNLVLVVFGIPYALFTSVVVTALAATFPGTPLSVAASWLLRRRTSLKAHLIAQFGAGSVTGATVVAVYLAISHTDPFSSGRFFLVTIAGIAVLAGVCAALGWFAGVRWAESRPLPVVQVRSHSEEVHA